MERDIAAHIPPVVPGIVAVSRDCFPADLSRRRRDRVAAALAARGTDLFASAPVQLRDYRPSDLFMGFHCGNTASCLLKGGALKYQLIMKRTMEPDTEPDITVGTLEGTLKESPVTLFRLQSTAEGNLCAYIAQGDTLDLDPRSFGAIGVIGIREMSRFYRHVLLEKRFPHHAGVGFAPCGRTLFSVLQVLGISDVSYNQPADRPYPTENPFR